MQLERERLLDLEAGLATEWLETDGLGGYASSTIYLCPTRRYHGLLVGRPPRNAKRHVFVSRFEEEARIGGETHALSMARYPDTWSPRGDLCLEHFALAPFPTFRYRLGDVELRREFQLVHGRAVALCRYEAIGGEVDLELRPLTPFREADATTVRNDVLDPSIERTEGGVRTRPYDGLPALELTTGGVAAEIDADPRWYERARFIEDERRGYEASEDQFSPVVIRARLVPGKALVVAMTVGERVAQPARLWNKEARLRRAAAEAPDARIELAADDHLYRDAQGRLGVNAGFPWFGEWGRDTFIALPGLTLARGQVTECGEALSGARAYLRDGLVPNIYGTSREDSHYGSIDASLWFARAVWLFEQAGGPEEQILDEFLPALDEIANAYLAGTELETRVDDGGLVQTGSPELNPTWMDAQTPAGPVTPRYGCPVEINALWYSLLAHLERLCERTGGRERRREWNERRRLAKRTFLERFWLPGGEYLADLWRDGVADERVRPNMVIAAAMELSPLTRKLRAGIVQRSRDELLTPKGLRTLSPRAPEYCKSYRGGPDERDAAYHQGTVWPWLLGFHVEAELRARPAKKADRDHLATLWDGIVEEMNRAGLNHVSEVFDGDPPHHPGGTIAQAWNTAELLRSRDMLKRTRP